MPECSSAAARRPRRPLSAALLAAVAAAAAALLLSFSAQPAGALPVQLKVLVLTTPGETESCLLLFVLQCCRA